MINEEFLQSLNIEEDAISKILQTLLEDRKKEEFEKILKNEIEALNPHDIDIILSLFDPSGLEVEDGKIEGLTEKLEDFREKYPFLFINSKTPKIISSTKAPEKYTKEDFNKMSYKEKSQLYQKNPSLYKKLANA